MAIKNWVYTDLTLTDSLTLYINEVEYAVASFVAGFDLNSIPTATCMLALGREAWNGLTPAQANTSAPHRPMEEAEVWFHPNAEYSLDNNWPAEAQLIFLGYFNGWTYRKVMGKVQLVAHLVHWLAALNMTSAVTGLGHPTNPAQLNAAAILPNFGSAGAVQGNNLSGLIGDSLTADFVQLDLWAGIKTLFCALANSPTTMANLAFPCGGSTAAFANTMALNALGRIEGPVDTTVIDADLGEIVVQANCSLAYTWGVPLAMNVGGAPAIADSVANAIGFASVASIAGTTLWAKLLGDYCPSYQMAIVPRVETAVVIADTPALRPRWWRTINPLDYEAIEDLSGELQFPLGGVGVFFSYEMQTQQGLNANPVSLAMPVGCYIEDSVQPGDGVLLYVQAPSWLSNLQSQPGYTGLAHGVTGQTPTPTATNLVSNPLNNLATVDTLSNNLHSLYTAYAQSVFVGSMLRGRAAAIGGKLRFDIAPGSIVRIVNTPEVFLGLDDVLANTLYGCVQRVSISINAEAGLAGTTLVLSHVRGEYENQVDRTSVAAHPLFGDSIFGNGQHGCPLVDAYAFTDEPDNPEPANSPLGG